MKKTVSINIKGINFMIEEDAYELLQDYLERLGKTLKNEEGSEEIIEDIELRIAEICSAKLTDGKTVIEYSDIQEILATLGNPEDYIEDEDENGQTNYSSNSQKKSEKRLFRDTENGTIAGVCSGIANFFNIDVVIIRAIFVIFFLFAGFGFPLYIILWIIVPQTKSTIDRLRMKGKPITVETVREEVEMAAEKIKNGSKNFANKLRKDDGYQKSINRGGRILTSILGTFFIGLGILFLILLIVFGIAEMQVFPVQGSNGFLSMPELGSLVLQDNGDYNLFWWGSVIFDSGIVLFLILLGLMLIFRISNTWAKVSLLLLFLASMVGFLMCATVGMRTGRDFLITGELEHVVGEVNTQILTILPEKESLKFSDDFTIKSNGKHHMMKIDEKTITFHGINIYYEESEDSLFHVSQNFRTQSHSHEVALEKCKNIEQYAQLSNDTLTLSPSYSFPKEDKIRAQSVEIHIEIPKGGQIKIDGETIINAIDEDNEYESHFYEHGKLKYNGRYYHWD